MKKLFVFALILALTLTSVMADVDECDEKYIYLECELLCEQPVFTTTEIQPLVFDDNCYEQCVEDMWVKNQCEEPDVPEFGIVAGVMIVALAGLFILKRRNN